MPPTPASASRELLTQIMEALGGILRSLRPHPEFQTALQSNPISLGIVLINAPPENLSPVQIALKHFLINTSAFGQMDIPGKLERLVASDAHIKATCRNPWGLARTIELLTPGLIAQVADKPGDDTYAYGAVTPHLLDRIFETDYRRQALIHIYNLELETPPPFDIPIFAATILTLKDQEIPLLTGEITPMSALHRPGTGNNFISFIDNGTSNDFEWMEAKWKEACEITRVLKYGKYGIVDNDYGGIFYVPSWMNTVWKVGIFMWGQPRRDVQPVRYRIQHNERQLVLQYLTAATALIPVLASNFSLRRATEFAGNYYEAHHGRVTREDQLIDLAIAFEALFSPTHEGELRFRMAQRLAILTGGTENERKERFALAKKIYDQRSKLIHGEANPFSSASLTVDELAAFGDLIRIAILKLIVWIARGEHDKQHAEKLLDEAALDRSALETIRLKTDLNSYLSDLR